jgi:hypothetical protein
VVEYYDHSVDPQENVNLAAGVPSRAVAAEIAALLTRLQSGWRAALIPAAPPSARQYIGDSSIKGSPLRFDSSKDDIMTV